MNYLIQTTFRDHPASLIYETTSPDDLTEEEEVWLEYRKIIDPSKTNTPSAVSNYYICTGTPPHGYGTQAPKVAETVSRAYRFNLKRSKKTIRIDDKYDVERLNWEFATDGDFPHEKIHGNYIPSGLKDMTASFVQSYHQVLDDAVERVMQDLLNTNSDTLTSGRQTFCPFTGQSTTAAIAYKRALEFLTTNLGNIGSSCLDRLKATMKIFELNSIQYLTLEEYDYKRKVYNRVTKENNIITEKRLRKVYKTTASVEETREVMLKLTFRFASYIKHKERGKKDRRAICSAGMFLRMFLKVIEDLHLLISSDVKGSTISIGGEMKKMKIDNHLTVRSLAGDTAPFVTQGTEDATKWNECLAPGAFAMMHRYLFDSDTRTSLGLPCPSSWGKLWSSLTVVGNFFMSMKEIQIGAGLQVRNDTHYSRLNWIDKHIPMMSAETKEWYEEIKDKITEDRKYFKASPGMLMGMLNAGSTT